MIVEEPFRGDMNCFTRCSCGLGIFPALFTACSVITIIITYIIAVSDGHVYPYFPAISDTGGVKPESNVFGFLLSACGFLGFVVVVIRYYQYRFVSENNEEWYSHLILVNKIAMLFGIVSVLGAVVVAAYQDTGVSLNMHIAGAMCVFGGGIVYCFLQSYLSIRMLACGMNTRRLCWLRILISVLALGFFIGNLTCGQYANKVWKLDPPPPKNCTRPLWRPDCPRFEYNVAGNICEWLMALSLFSFFLTFVREFNNVKMSFNVRKTEYSTLVPFQRSTSDDEPNQSFIGQYA